MPRKLITYYFTPKKGKRNLSLNLYKIQQKIKLKVKKKTEAPGFACHRIKASFTVEAAVVLPIVLIVCVMMLYFFRLLQVETCIQSAINYAARETAVYAGELTGTSAEGSEALLRLKAKGKVRKYIKNSGCDCSFIERGISGLSFAKSEYTGEEIFLCVTYRFHIPLTFLGRKSFTVTQSSAAHKWTGRQDEDLDETGTWVYITETGTAYHKTDACSYLKLSVKSVSKAQVKEMRNKNGGKYYPCSVCRGEAWGTVYVTDYGTVYHALPECRGLKRTIYHVRLESLNGYHPCGKCCGN